MERENGDKSRIENIADELNLTFVLFCNLVVCVAGIGFEIRFLTLTIIAYHAAGHISISKRH